MGIIRWAVKWLDNIRITCKNGTNGNQFTSYATKAVLIVCGGHMSGLVDRQPKTAFCACRFLSYRAVFGFAYVPALRG